MEQALTAGSGNRAALIFLVELLPLRLTGEGVSLSGITEDQGCIICTSSAIVLMGAYRLVTGSPGEWDADLLG
jgi:hypothetical protein